MTPITEQFLIDHGFHKVQSGDKRKSHACTWYSLAIPRHLYISVELWKSRGEDQPFQITPRISSSATFGGDALRVPSDRCCSEEHIRLLCRVFGWDLDAMAAIRDTEL